MQIVQLAISGIAQGCIYGLIALGFVLIYKATETVSFAQGELIMLGAFCGLVAMALFGLPFWLAVVGAIAVMALFGVLLELAVIRPILGQPAFSIVMLTIGIGYVARGLITTIPGIGTETHTLPVPYKDLVWGLAAAVAAIAGLLLAPITFVHANMGVIGLKAFPAAVVGGFGSLPGAIGGGLVIGIVESLSGFYLPEGPSKAGC